MASKYITNKMPWLVGALLMSGLLAMPWLWVYYWCCYNCECITNERIAWDVITISILLVSALLGIL